ncbi:MAG TPA: PhoU domain-containing protein [Hyphomicrobiaceae bacterium]|nr:PhoU domain-containing protein [Hyphomicrobiaceae bacterium]
MSILSRILARKPAKPAADAPVAGASSIAMSQEAVAAAQPHTVASFDTDLVVLANMVEHMALRAGRALSDATRALVERNAQLAQQVIVSDCGLDLLQHEIEEKAVNSPPTAFSGACTTSTAATGWKVAPPSLNRMPASCRSSAGSSSKPMA